MANQYHDPVYHSPASSAGVTISETGRGAVKGTFLGMLVGAVVLGALYAAIPALISYGLFSVAGSGALGLAVTGLGWLSGGLAVLAGFSGAITGIAGGGGVGAALGAFKGFGKGREQVARDRGMASVLETEYATARAQEEIAQAIKAQQLREAVALQAIARQQQQQPQAPVVTQAAAPASAKDFVQFLMANPQLLAGAENREAHGTLAAKGKRMETEENKLAGSHAERVKNSEALAEQAAPQMS